MNEGHIITIQTLFEKKLGICEKTSHLEKYIDVIQSYFLCFPCYQWKILSLKKNGSNGSYYSQKESLECEQNVPVVFKNIFVPEFFPNLQEIQEILLYGNQYFFTNLDYNESQTVLGGLPEITDYLQIFSQYHGLLEKSIKKCIINKSNFIMSGLCQKENQQFSCENDDNSGV